jgi:hypothetical protein
LTSVTVDEFPARGHPFAVAFLHDMTAWTLHGRRRQARRSTTEKNGPLPTPEDRLLCIRVYRTPHPTPRLHGRVFGRRQAKAPPWRHV